MANFYNCPECGRVLLELSDEKDSCGAKTLELIVPNTVDAAAEKHVPVVSGNAKDCTVTVRIGAEPHPMTPEHHIEWVYVKTSYGGTLCRLAPGDPPEAVLRMLPDEAEEVYIYCNLHGLWKAKEPVLPLSFEVNNVACSPEFTAGCVDHADSR